MADPYRRTYEEIEPPDTPRNLTEKEREVYDFLYSFVSDERRWPTYREIRERFDWKSDESVTQNLKVLYGKGWIERLEWGEWSFRTGVCPYCGQDINEH